MKFNTKQHILLCLLACVPVYWAALYYIEIVTKQELEEIAVAATIGFFGCVYAGRYLAQVWVAYKDAIPGKLLLSLGLLVSGNLVWLFVHADYPLRGRPGMDLLLYWLSFVALSMALGMLIRLITIGQHRLEQARAGEAHSQSELRLLQSQLSPHFLFNTLNNLYGISITRHQEIPGLLLKLSELLRYSVYDAKDQFVLLKEEIAYIRNYIDFEQIRIGDKLKLDVHLEEVGGQAKIAPMLLIAFVENAFKHSKNSLGEHIEIAIDLKTWANSILFEVKNSYEAGREKNITPDKYSGFGLDNTRKRLDLLYPKEYDLKVEDRGGFYKVMLQVRIK